jgi:hypothetical protein
MVFEEAELLSFLILDWLDTLDGDLFNRSNESCLFILFDPYDYLLENLLIFLID